MQTIDSCLPRSLAEELNPGDDDDPLTQAATHAAAAAAAADAKACVPSVFNVLAQAINPREGGMVFNMAGASPAAVQTSALRCLSKWAPFGATLAALNQAQLLEPILGKLANTDDIADVTDVLVASMEASAEAVPEAVSAAMLQPLVAHTQVVTTALSQDEQDWMYTTDECLGISRLATEVGRRCAPSQLQKIPGTWDLFLACLQHPFNLVSESTLPFWETIGETKLSGDDAANVATLLGRAAEVMLKRCQVAADFTTWADSGMDEEDFEHYRRHLAGEIFRLAAEKLGGANLVIVLLRAAWQEITWQEREARLFAAMCISDDVISDLAQDIQAQAIGEVLSNTVQVIVNRGWDTPIAARTGVAFLAAYSAWLGDAERITELLMPILSHIILLLNHQVPDVASHASTAMATISRACKPAFADQTLLQTVIHRIAAAPMSALPPDARTRLIEALSRVIGAAPTQLAAPLLETMLTPVVAQLNNLVAKGANADPEEVVSVMQVLGASVKGMPPAGLGSQGASVHASMPVLHATWPSLCNLMQYFGAINSVADTYAQLCTAAMRSAGLAFAPLLQSTAQVLTGNFSTHKCLGYLRGLNTMVAVFGSVADMASSFGEVLTSVSVVVFETLGAYRHQPDVVVTYFELVLAFLVCATSSSVTHPLFPTIFELACSCLHLPETQPVAIVTQILVWVAKHCHQGTEGEKQTLGGVVTAHGAIMIQAVIYGIASSFMLEFVPRAADIFAPLLAERGADVQAWTSTVLQDPNLPVDQGALSSDTRAAFVRLLGSYADAAANPQRLAALRQMLGTFAAVCRKKRPPEALAQF